MAENEENKRGEERFGTSLPVDLGASTGVTHDISATGVFFETDGTYAPGNRINFSVELETPGGKLMLRCWGNIVRIEPHDKSLGVAVKIVESKLEAIGPWEAAPASKSEC